MSYENLISEETVRQRVSIYLQSLGFGIDQIEHESRTIPIRAFRNVEMKIGKKNRQTAHGRIDILVRTDNKDPLFVVEVKRPGVNISEGKDQAIAYARLLLAPLVVITNGTETKLFDPLTREGNEINNAAESAYAKNDFKVDISDDIKSLALSHFIGYNLENLLVFCEAQRNNRMCYLKGEKISLEKKYIPELYVSPPDLEEDFSKFLNRSDKKSVFLIHGESGSGKTNAMCYLADKIGAQYPTLFFAASVLGRNIRDEIETDFNYNFSGERSTISIIKRISEILQKNDTKLIIFIDAIDEYGIPNANVAITDFFDEISKFDRIYLCVSAKTTRINDFLYVNGIPTLATSYQEYICKRLDDETLKKILHQYGTVYSTSGNIEGQIREECRLPLFTRVLHEGYSGSKLPLKIEKNSLIEKFLDKKFEKIPASCHLTIHALLQNMTRLMYEKGSSSLSIPDVLSLLSQSIDDYLNSLLEHYVLVKEDSRVSFYYDRVRDYYLAFKVKQWQSMTSEDFGKEIQTITSNPIFQSAILWYADVAPIQHQDIMVKHIQLNALRYVEKYEYYLTTYFNRIKMLFEPFTDESIGIVIFKNANDSRVTAHGFRPINPGEDKVQLKIIEGKAFDMFSRPLETENIKILHGGGFNFITPSDVDSYSKDVIFRSLDKIIENKSLLEDENLMIERLLKIISDYNIELGYGEFEENFWDNVFPIDLEHFRNYRIGHMILWTKHAIQIFDEKHRDKYPGTRYYGKGVPHNLKLMTSLMYGDYEEIKKRVDSELKGIWSAKVALSDIQIGEVSKMVDYLLTKRKEIEGPILPFGDKFPKSPRKGGWSALEYTSRGMKEYLHQFFKLSLIAYRNLVENNFPALKKSLLSGYEFPSHVIGLYSLGDGPNNFGSVHYTIIRNEVGSEDEIEIYEDDGKSLFNVEDFSVNTKYGTKRTDWWHETVMESFFQELTMQKWCYDTLKEGIKSAYAEIK